MKRFTSIVHDRIPLRSSSSSSSTSTLSSTSSSSAAAMSNVSISSGSSQHSATEWDTGFPDSFAYHTTSRRHPDAKLGEFAVIQAVDVDPHYAIHNRKSLLLKKHRRTISHGKVTPLETILSSEAESETSSNVEADHEPHLDEHTEPALERPTSSESSTSDRGKRKSLFRWRGH